jgi:monoamine oxidase
MIAKSRRFKEAKENAIMEVRYVQVTKVLLQYKKCWWERIAGNGGGMVCDLPIRYTMFPSTRAGISEAINNTHDDENSPENENLPNKRGVIMAAYAFGQDASLLGSMEPADRVIRAAQDLETVFPGYMKYLETGTSQAFCEDRMTGGSAFCYFGPGQKAKYQEAMRASDWPYPVNASDATTCTNRALFAGEHASYAHGWIQGAIGVALRCVDELASLVSPVQVRDTKGNGEPSKTGATASDKKGENDELEEDNLQEDE